MTTPISYEQHKQWMAGFAAAMAGASKPTESEQARGWRAATHYANHQAAEEFKQDKWDIYDEELELAQYGWRG